MTRTPLPARLMPLGTRLGVVPLHGDLHNHCDLSYGHGRFEDALRRGALQLDFLSITGHAHWPDMPVDDPSVAHIVDFHVRGFDKLKRAWPGHYDALRAADRPDFTLFPGYEIHSSAHGDYTVVYRDLDGAPMELADSPAALRAALDATRPGRAFAFPHHIGYRQGARGINWDSFDPALSPFVEMLSMHGCAEESEGLRPYLHSMGPSDGQGTARHGLALGQVFGMVGNTDHHSGFPGSYGHGRTVAYATGRGRQAIWDALTGRHVNALTGAEVHLLAAVDGAIQGSVVTPRAGAVLEVEAVASGAIDSIDVIRNGTLWRRITPVLEPAPIGDDPDETILYLELGWGARGSRHRWEGEVTLEGGQLLSLEPRFRGGEVVSPLEGADAGHALPFAVLEGGAARFDLTAEANPNNATPATQGIALRLTVADAGTVRARFGAARVEVPVARLRQGAMSGNLGAIDSPAWRMHRLPARAEWQWQGRLALGDLTAGETVYLRLREATGQMAWTSPIFCRA